MKEDNPYISHLFQKYLEGSYSEEDLDTLLAYFKLDEDSAQLRELIEQQFDRPIPEAVDQEEIESRVVRIGTELEQKINPPIKIKRFKWWYAAASIFLISTIVSISYLYIKDTETRTILTSQFGDDVLPGGNRAYITLSSGKRIELDSTQTGLISTNGKHAYIDGTELLRSSVAEFATVHTPIGGQYHIILPDGSEAWLNAASTIKYPLQFGKEQRSIETTGEVYLEVKSDKTKPFIVHTGEQRIRVLGTAFNVRSYEEGNITTLVHGRIALENVQRTAKVILNPGEQSRMVGHTYQVEKIDPSDFVGWKDGTFTNNDATLQETCQELERWYGVKFIFPVGFSNKEVAFNTIDRKEKLSVVLDALKTTYRVDFEIKGKEVMVK